MKATTQVREAVKLCYAAQSEYYRIVENIPVTTPKPRVRYEAFKGFYINDILYTMPAKAIIAEFDQCQREWHERIKDHRREQAARAGAMLPGFEPEELSSGSVVLREA